MFFTIKLSITKCIDNCITNSSFLLKKGSRSFLGIHLKPPVDISLYIALSDMLFFICFKAFSHKQIFI